MKLQWLLILVFLLVPVGQANATLVGDQISLTLDSGTVGASPLATVGAGIEYAFTDSNGGIFTWTVDVSDSTIFIEGTQTASSTAGFQRSFFFTDLDWVGVSGIITNATVTSFTGFSGFTGPPNVFDFGDDFLSFTTENYGASVGIGGTVSATITLETAHVPEPSTMLLFGTGVLGLIGYARRRKRV